MKTLKRITALTLALILLVGGVATASVPPMEDVSPDDWFYVYVTHSFRFSLTTGTSEEGFRFEPHRAVTRGEFITMLGRLHEYSGETIGAPGDSPFYASYLAWAVEHGIIQGNEHGDLMPDALVTREQMAVFVDRYIEAFGLEGYFPPPHTHSAMPNDYQDISNWARQEVLQVLYRYGLMSGITPGWPIVFSPQANTSRAETLAVLVRLGTVLDNANRFVLTISVEETSLPQGEPFRVNVELKNNSGEDLEIFHHFLFWPFIPNWNLFDDWGVGSVSPARETRFFEAGSVLRNIGIWGNEVDGWFVGTTLEPGEHELRFHATFYLNWGQENQQEISIWSNPITLTVQ